MRMPGGIKEITISGFTDPFLPINFEDRFVESTKTDSISPQTSNH